MKFSISAVGDFGARVVNEQVRQALHKSQTNLKSADPRGMMLKDGGLLNVVDFDLPDVTISRDDLMGWVLASMRSNYGGPPFVLAVDLLDDKYEVIAVSPGVESEPR